MPGRAQNFGEHVKHLAQKRARAVARRSEHRCGLLEESLNAVFGKLQPNIERRTTYFCATRTGRCRSDVFSNFNPRLDQFLPGIPPPQSQNQTRWLNARETR